MYSTANNFANDVVNFRNCNFDVCYIACFSDCDCAYPDGTACSTTSPPPTPPPTSAPTLNPEKNCAQQENTDQCPTVAVASNLRAGAECPYCYNFCDGEFLGCCDEAGQCSQTPCTGVKVYGCPEIFGVPTAAPNAEGTRESPAPPTDPSGAGALGLSSTLAAVAALVFLAREFN